MMSRINSGSRKCTRLIPTALALVGITASTANAMPYYKTESGLTSLKAAAIASDPTLSGSAVFSDHIARNQLFISPSSKKTQTGNYEITAPPACEILSNQYYLTYMVPTEKVESWDEVALKGPVSGYFDSHYGNYIRHHTIIEEMAQGIIKIESYRMANPKIVEEYEAAEAVHNFALASQLEAKTAFESYTLRLRSLTDSAALISTPDGMALLKDQIAAVQAEFAENRPALAKAIAESNVKVNNARTRFAAAKGAYNAVVPDETKINNRIAVLNTLFDSLQTSSKQVFTDNNVVLTQFETVGVGIARASFSIWGDEEARFRAIVSQTNPEYSVSRLPIYDIRLNPVQANTTPSSITSSEPRIDAILNNGSSLALINNSSPTIGNSVEKGLPVFQSDGKPVEPQVTVLSGAGAGTYQTLVSRGAYCTGNSARQYRTATPENTLVSDAAITTMKVGVFQPRESNVLAQSVALSYTYNLKNDPISISCEMDIKKFSSYTSSKKSSGFLFWRKSRTNEDRALLQESGIFCKNESNDFGGEALAKAEVMMDEMQREIGAEYILQYAKSYEVTTFKESEMPNPGAAAEKMGTAMQALCGANVYCQVGSIVLKNGNELFGSSSGSSSGSDSITGKISRKYYEHSYTSLPGSAVVDLTVTL
ncbi:MAG: hypothetical protein EOP04_06565 [Proteobacteria bacterium]|nr:MAG: hypothetical protein EOP04_06565 [Pseudomonadota bacterium]